MTDVSVILVSYNTAGLLDRCLDRLGEALQPVEAEVFVVDNASRDGSLEVLSRRAGCRVIANPVNVGFGRANNQVLPSVRGRFLLLLNTDAFVEPDSVRKAIDYMEAHPRCAVLGARLVDASSRFQPSYRPFPRPWSWFVSRAGLQRWLPGAGPSDNAMGDVDHAVTCDWVPGCFYLVRRSTVDRLGLFDPRFFVYYEEVDHCRSVRDAGHEVHYFPGTTVVHIGGESAKSDSDLSTTGRQNSALQTESEFLYFRKRHGMLGVWATLVLGQCAELVWALRALRRNRGAGAWTNAWRNVVQACSIFFKTHAGSRATR